FSFPTRRRDPTSGCRSSITKLVSFPEPSQVRDPLIRRCFPTNQLVDFHVGTFLRLRSRDRRELRSAVPLQIRLFQFSQDLRGPPHARLQVFLGRRPGDQRDLTLLEMRDPCLKVDILRVSSLTKARDDAADPAVGQPLVLQVLQNQRYVLTPEGQTTQ